MVCVKQGAGRIIYRPNSDEEERWGFGNPVSGTWIDVCIHTDHVSPAIFKDGSFFYKTPHNLLLNHCCLEVNRLFSGFFFTPRLTLESSVKHGVPTRGWLRHTDFGVGSGSVIRKQCLRATCHSHHLSFCTTELTVVLVRHSEIPDENKRTEQAFESQCARRHALGKVLKRGVQTESGHYRFDYRLFLDKPSSNAAQA